MAKRDDYRSTVGFVKFNIQSLLLMVVKMYYEDDVDVHERKSTNRILWKIFINVINNKGRKCLNYMLLSSYYFSLVSDDS